MATKKTAAAEPAVEKIGLHNLTPSIGSLRSEPPMDVARFRSAQRGECRQHPLLHFAF